MQKTRCRSRESQIVLASIVCLLVFFQTTSNYGQIYAYPWTEKVLDRRISVRYEHVNLGYVYEQVRHLGCRAFIPFRLRDQGDLIVTSRSITIRELFERVAKSGGMKMDYLDGEPIFSKPITDERFNELRAAIRNSNSSGRGNALDEMLATVEMRVYPELFWVIANGDIDSARKAFEELQARYTGQVVFDSRVSLRHLDDYENLFKGIERIARNFGGTTNFNRVALPPHHILFYLPISEQNRFRKLYPKEAKQTLGEPRLLPYQTFDQLLELMNTAVPVPLPNGGCPVGNLPPPINRGEVVRAMIDCDLKKAVKYLERTAKTVMASDGVKDNWPITVCEGLVESKSDLAAEFATYCNSIEPMLDNEQASIPAFNRFHAMRPATERLLKSLIVANDLKYVETIGAFLNDKDALIRQLAIEGLARSRDPRAARLLEEFLNRKTESDHGPEKIAIVNGLAVIGDPKSTEIFATSLTNKGTREMAIYYLASVGDPRGDALLAELFSSQDATQFRPDVSWASFYHEFALAELAKLGQRLALDELEQRMYDSTTDFEFQGFAVHSRSLDTNVWAYLTYSDSVKSATEKLSPKNSDAERLAAARSLVLINPMAGSIKQRELLYDKEALMAVQGAIRDQNSEVRKIAKWIIRRQNSK